MMLLVTTHTVLLVGALVAVQRGEAVDTRVLRLFPRNPAAALHRVEPVLLGERLTLRARVDQRVEDGVACVAHGIGDLERIR